MPNMLTMRPGDGNETAGCYAAAVLNAAGQNTAGIRRPSTMVFSRQGMVNMDTTSREGTLKGAYVVAGGEGTPDAILIGARWGGLLGGGCWAAAAATGGSRAACLPACQRSPRPPPPPPPPPPSPPSLPNRHRL